MRLVVETKVLLSAAAFPLSVPRQALSEVLRHQVLLLSEATAHELKEVIFRPKFDRYVSREDRAAFLAQLGSVAEIVPVIQIIRECRGPRDDKFLEVALNGRADVIITRDADLLAMHPWRRIEVVSPVDYLKTVGS
jgi:uncharacterized protein